MKEESAVCACMKVGQCMMMAYWHSAAASFHTHSYVLSFHYLVLAVLQERYYDSTGQVNGMMIETSEQKVGMH